MRKPEVILVSSCGTRCFLVSSLGIWFIISKLILGCLDPVIMTTWQLNHAGILGFQLQDGDEQRSGKEAKLIEDVFMLGTGPGHSVY